MSEPRKRKADVSTPEKRLAQRRGPFPDCVNALYDVEEQTLGRGGFGQIFAAICKATNKQVAIKKISNIFFSCKECKQLLREARIMRHFSHENIMSLDDMIVPCGQNDVYLVMPRMDTDLHRVIHSKQPLTEDHISYFSYQILRGLKAIHSARVLHRDLKPANCLVNQNCELKICDFGLARGVEPVEEDLCLTEYVATRWYRAPELLIGSASYDGAIDIWSVGCILAEMLGKRALLPGRDTLQQLRMIVECLGVRAEEDLEFISNPKAAQYIRAISKPKAHTPFEMLFPSASAAALDLLRAILLFNPRQRLDAVQALDHPFLKSLHTINAEPDAQPFHFDETLQHVKQRAGSCADEAQLRRLITEESTRRRS